MYICERIIIFFNCDYYYIKSYTEFTGKTPLLFEEIFGRLNVLNLIIQIIQKWGLGKREI